MEKITFENLQLLEDSDVFARYRILFETEDMRNPKGEIHHAKQLNSLVAAITADNKTRFFSGKDMGDLLQNINNFLLGGC